MLFNFNYIVFKIENYLQTANIYNFLGYCLSRLQH